MGYVRIDPRIFVATIKYNIMHNKIIIAIILALLMTACGSEESFEDKIIGTWTGNLTQPDCCTFDIEVDITSLAVGSNIAQGQYSNSNYDICDNEIFFCDELRANPSNCSFTWTLDSFTDPSLVVFEGSNGNCAQGLITLRLIDDKTLSYRFVDQDDPANISMGQISKS